MASSTASADPEKCLHQKLLLHLYWNTFNTGRPTGISEAVTSELGAHISAAPAWWVWIGAICTTYPTWLHESAITLTLEITWLLFIQASEKHLVSKGNKGGREFTICRLFGSSTYPLLIWPYFMTSNRLCWKKQNEYTTRSAPEAKMNVLTFKEQ